MFFRNIALKTYFPVRISEGEIEERVILKNQSQSIDVSQRHNLICLEPFVIAIWLTRQLLDGFISDCGDLHIKTGAKINASLKISLLTQLEFEDNNLLLYRIENAKCHQFHWIYNRIILAWFLRTKTTTFYKRLVFGAVYSYPVKVITVSFKDNDYCNIFPMDLSGYIVESDVYILGLRTTNIALGKILTVKKIVISDTDNADINVIYSLGKHHSTTPPKLNDLPFNIVESELFKFPVPDFSASYKEIEIIKSQNLGSHMLLIGKVVNQKQMRNRSSFLHHIHYFQFGNSNYQELN